MDPFQQPPPPPLHFPPFQQQQFPRQGHQHARGHRQQEPILIVSEPASHRQNHHEPFDFQFQAPFDVPDDGFDFIVDESGQAQNEEDEYPLPSEKPGSIIAYKYYKLTKIDTWKTASKVLIKGVKKDELQARVKSQSRKGDTVYDQMENMGPKRANQIARLVEDEERNNKNPHHEWSCGYIKSKKSRTGEGKFDVPSMEVILVLSVKTPPKKEPVPEPEQKPKRFIPGEIVDLDEQPDGKNKDKSKDKGKDKGKDKNKSKNKNKDQPAVEVVGSWPDEHVVVVPDQQPGIHRGHSQGNAHAQGHAQGHPQVHHMSGGLPTEPRQQPMNPLFTFNPFDEPNLNKNSNPGVHFHDDLPGQSFNISPRGHQAFDPNGFQGGQNLNMPPRGNQGINHNEPRPDPMPFHANLNNQAQRGAGFDQAGHNLRSNTPFVPNLNQGAGRGGMNPDPFTGWNDPKPRQNPNEPIHRGEPFPEMHQPKPFPSTAQNETLNNIFNEMFGGNAVPPRAPSAPRPRGPSHHNSREGSTFPDIGTNHHRGSSVDDEIPTFPFDEDEDDDDGGNSSHTSQHSIDFEKYNPHRRGSLHNSKPKTYREHRRDDATRYSARSSFIGLADIMPEKSGQRGQRWRSEGTKTPHRKEIAYDNGPLTTISPRSYSPSQESEKYQKGIEELENKLKLMDWEERLEQREREIAKHSRKRYEELEQELNRRMAHRQRGSRKHWD